MEIKATPGLDTRLLAARGSSKFILSAFEIKALLSLVEEKEYELEMLAERFEGGIINECQ